ncbi:hypothetical protein [Flavobacterium selenitireducens]|uniref:hypothetical protein n=1 Tax=Flavobacterium selenitireducens TaxID=2722704 RepID=UPI00168AB4DE|nr:hypothetical protein [Flavobacterium selenitireducens]MBD3581657.1 hypothetical protein [Flavobacterium selenitireducens]
MKKLIALMLLFAGFSVSAQGPAELMGKWKLVKWEKDGKVQNISAHYKTDAVFQVFKDNGVFQQVTGKQISDGTWKFSHDRRALITDAGLLPTTYKIVFFDAKRRIVTQDGMGTFTYEKV